MIRPILFSVVAAGCLAAGQAEAHQGHRHVVKKPAKVVVVPARTPAKVVAVAQKKRANVVVVAAKQPKVVAVVNKRPVKVVRKARAPVVIATLPRTAVVLGKGPGRLYLVDGRYYRKVAHGYRVVV